MVNIAVGRAGYHRVRGLFRDHATTLIGRVIGASDLFEDTDGGLTAIARDARRMVLDLPADAYPEVLPDDLRSKLEVMTRAHIDVELDDVRHALRAAFRVAGVFVTRGAFARRAHPDVVTYYVEVLRRLEQLVWTTIETENVRERSRIEHRDRFVSASALYELLPDPLIEAAAADDLVNSGDDPAAIHDPFVADELAAAGPVVAVVVVPVSEDARLPSIRDLPASSLCALTTSESVVVLPSSEVHVLVDQFAALFGDSWAAIGLPTDADDIASSLAWARRARDLRAEFDVEELTGRGGGIVACDELPLAMLIGADRELLRRLRARVLAPFEGLSTFRRTILLETLAAWARDPGAGAPAIARDLDRHPQTVRYRLKQLRQLLGDDLDDPQTMLLIRLMFVLAPRA